jgi:hypothetical protein
VKAAREARSLVMLGGPGLLSVGKPTGTRIK